MNSVMKIVAISVASVGLAGLVHAQTPASDATRGSPGDQHETMGKDKAMQGAASTADPSGADPATFVKKAALGGMTEVEAGKLAQAKAQDPQVKAFATRMVKDHEKANAELATLAKSKGMQVPAMLDAEHKSKLAQLSAKSGADFDKAYSSAMVMDHDKTVALFEGAAKNPDSDLAAFAKKTLPTLKEHKQMTRSLPGAMAH